MTTLLYTMLTAYLLAIAIMLLIPDGWMPKGSAPDSTIAEKGFHKKVVIIGGAIIIAIAIVITCFIG